MDMEKLMTREGFREFTDEQRDTFTNDAGQTRQMAQIIQARIANTKIDGDRAGHAGRRARKVARRLNKVARLLERAAAETEAVNAVYVREVLELPARRAHELAHKQTDRLHRLGIPSAVHDKAVKSLTTSVNTLHGVPQATPQVNGMPQPVQYVNPTAYQFPSAAQTQPTGNITDYFPEAL